MSFAGVIAWGDVPTWLAVIGAMAAAVIALGQLRAQQKDIARQTRQLERQQADAIDLAPGRITAQEAGISPDDVQEFHVAMVSNSSSRPIREISGRLDPGHGESPLLATRFGHYLPLQIDGPVRGPDKYIPIGEGTQAAVLRAGAAAGFTFPVLVSDRPDARMAIRFTDDAGLYWQIDNDLHLEKLQSRDDW